MSKRLFLVCAVASALLSACGVAGVQGVNAAGGTMTAEAKKRLTPRPTPMVDTLFDYTIRQVRAANGVTQQVELAYVVGYAGSKRVDMVTRRFRADCAKGAAAAEGVKVVKLVVSNELMSLDRDGSSGRVMPENKGLTLILDGNLKSAPAPNALALDVELNQVVGKLKKGEPFLEKGESAKGEDLQVLQAFAKATQQALAGR
jgi:hypothetical protein